MDLSNELSCVTGSFSHCHNLPQVFTARGFEAFFSPPGTLCCVFCLAPQLFLLVYLHANVRLPTLPAATLLCIHTAPAAHLHPSYQGMNVSSLSPWLSDFHTVFWQFCFLFFVFKFVVVLVLVVCGGRVYLPMPLSQLEFR